MSDCIFCKIVNGDIPCFKVMETNDVFVFLDVNPNTNGHLLFIPKVHYKDVLDISSEILIKIYELIKEMMNKLDDILKPTGYTLVQNNGSAGEVKHFHIHLIPRYDNDLLEHKYNKAILKDIVNVYTQIKTDIR